MFLASNMLPDYDTSGRMERDQEKHRRDDVHARGGASTGSTRMDLGPVSI